MPEGRRAPWRFFPRPGASLSVTFGAPLLEASVRATLEMASSVRESWRDDGGDGRYVKRGAVAEVETRIAVTELVQRAVEVLGRQVSGNLLTGPPYQQKIWRGFYVYILNRSHRKVLRSEGCIGFP